MSTLQKQIILGFAVILLGASFWYLLHYVFYVGKLTTGCWIAGGTLFLFWRIWQRGLPRLLTALFIVVALVYFFSPHPAEIAKREITIPRETFNSVIKPFEKLITERLPEGVNDLDIEASKILTPKEIKELK